MYGVLFFGRRKESDRSIQYCSRRPVEKGLMSFQLTSFLLKQISCWLLKMGPAYKVSGYSKQEHGHFQWEPYFMRTACYGTNVLDLFLSPFHLTKDDGKGHPFDAFGPEKWVCRVAHQSHPAHFLPCPIWVQERLLRARTAYNLVGISI